MKKLSRGITLIEMLVAMGIAAMVLAISFPSFTRGLDGIRLRAAGERVAAFLNAARNRAERTQAPVEIVIDPARGLLTAQAAGGDWDRRLELEGVRLAGNSGRQVLLPGVPPPRFRLRLESDGGRALMVGIDPLTGVPQIEEAASP